jgi:hypothetical protein
VFETVIFIKHVYSNEYVCIKMGEDGKAWPIAGNEVLCLQSTPNEECYF